MRILGVETSCDDTCVAIVEASGTETRPRFRVRANVVSSQVKTHAPLGGVTPTLAAREHAKNFAPVLRRALRLSHCRLQNIDLIAVTTHPGLLPSLLVGVHAARTLAWAAKKPIIGINHLQGHLVSALLPDPKSKAKNSPSRIQFPALALTVSGGHTQLVLAKDFTTFRTIGETRDDAAGEAFDKVGRLLGLPFPGGPHIAHQAKNGNPRAIDFPRPMLHADNFDFSFSGLKTAVLYFLRDAKRTKRLLHLPDVCASFQQAVIDVLIAKTLAGAKRYHAKTVILGGGVAANSELRKQLLRATNERLPHVALSIPHLPYTQDNAVMISVAGYCQWLRMSKQKRKQATWKSVRVKN